jgi:hypothetical protein
VIDSIGDEVVQMEEPHLQQGEVVRGDLAALELAARVVNEEVVPENRGFEL